MATEMQGIHRTVLLNEVVEGLSIKKGDIVLDATINAGGHAGLVGQMFGADVVLVGIDEDSNALKRAEAKLQKGSSKYFLKKSNFRNLDKVLEELEMPQIDKAIFDLGLSSDQLEASGRGFSFQKNEPLLMTLNDAPGKSDLTAYDVVNGFSQENLEAILKGFGEERFSGRIARNIVESRTKKPIETSAELAEIISKAVPAFTRKGKIHPATKSFQAIRIAVNGELDAILEGLTKAFERLRSHGRIAVISFHSIEDRVVKNYFKGLEKDGLGKNIFKKPLIPSREEIKENPRARSAKLRIIEKN